MFPVSIVVATCAMLSGIGGAAFFTPIFILVFPLLGPEYALESTLAAVGAALFTQTFGFLSGFVGYYRRKLTDYALAWRLLRVAVPAAVFGALAQSLPAVTALQNESTRPWGHSVGSTCLTVASFLCGMTFTVLLTNRPTQSVHCQRQSAVNLSLV